MVGEDSVGRRWGCREGSGVLGDPDVTSESPNKHLPNTNSESMPENVGLRPPGFGSQKITDRVLAPERAGSPPVK